jgi:hypothetical protein
MVTHLQNTTNRYLNLAEITLARKAQDLNFSRNSKAIEDNMCPVMGRFNKRSLLGKKPARMQEKAITATLSLSGANH